MSVGREGDLTPAPAGPRVVVAEDEAIIRLDLCETLAELGYRVEADCGRGDEALEVIRTLRPDVALLDIQMPGLDGLAVARALATERVCAVVILTAFSQRDLVEEARDAGVFAYLVKPFQRAELVPAIELAIGRFNELRALLDQTHTLEERLEVRTLLDRAKGMLMDRRAMTEADAFALIQRTAMSGRTTMRAVAERILAGDPLPGDPDPTHGSGEAQ